MKTKILLLFIPIALLLFGGNATAQNDCAGSLTYSQGGWGASANGNPAPNYLIAHFSGVFGTDGLVIGSTNKLKLTSAQAVNDFLPSGSTPSVLPSGVKVDPGTAYKNNFAGQLVALTLNVVFDEQDADFSAATTKLKDQIIASGIFKDKTVGEFLVIANEVIGGSSNAYSATDVNTAAAAINLNFDNGADNGYLICPLERLQPLTVNATLTASILCHGDNTGAASSTVAGGLAPYSYLWSNGSTSANLTGVPAGEYSLVVTDSKGNTAQASVVISQPERLVVTTAGTDISCFGNSDGAASATISGGTAPYVVSWSNGAATNEVAGLVAGTYVVSVTDANGCGASASVTLTQPELLEASAASTNVSCFGNADGSAALSIKGGTAPYTINWSNSSEDALLTGLVAGTYVASVTDAHGCSVGVSVEITQPEALAASAVSSDVLCFGSNEGTAAVSVKGGTAPYTYLWSNGATAESLSGLVAGTYSVTVTDAHGCTIEASATVAQPEQLEVSTSSTNVSCFGNADGSAALTIKGGTAPYTISWSNSSEDAILTGLVAGTYVASVTDAHGCSVGVSVEITQPQLLEAAATVSNVTCNGSNDGSAVLSVKGGTAPYTISWSTGAAVESVNGLAPGTYTALVVDSHDCSTSVEFTVTQPEVLSINGISVINVQCVGGTGSATLSVSGGTAPYTYNWIGIGAQSSNIASLPVGTFDVIVTDAHGCAATSRATLTLVAQKLTTVTPGGWGAKASGSNWGAYLDSHFAASFPAGLIIGSNGRYVKMTSAAAIHGFLPSGGTSVALKVGTTTNPTSSSLKNTLAGHTMALLLNTVFDADNAGFGASNVSLKDMVVATGTFKGWTVAEVLAEANKFLGAASSYSGTDLTNTLTYINQNYDNGTVNMGYLVLPCAGVSLRYSAVDKDASTSENSDALTLTADETSVSFSVNAASKVNLNVYDLNGQVVGNLYDGYVNANESKRVEWSKASLTKGLYMVRLVSETGSKNVKVMLK